MVETKVISTSILDYLQKSQRETKCAAQSKTLGLKLEPVVQEPPPQDSFLLGENYLPCPVFRPLYSETGAISATTAKAGP